MKFSIIIPTYNGEKRIENAIQEILNLDIDKNDKYEVIIIDNNSTDNTIELVKKFNIPNLRIIKEEKQGLFFARERGINESKSNWIFFIDDDIKVQPNWIKAFFKKIDKNHNLGLIAAPLKFPLEYTIPKTIQRFKTIYPITDSNIKKATKKNFLSSMLCLNKKAYFWLKNRNLNQRLKGRGFEGNKFNGGEDIEFSLYLKYSPFDVDYTDETFGYHYLEKNRLTFENCLQLKKESGNILFKIGPLFFGTKFLFKYISSYHYYIFRTYLSLNIKRHFSKEEQLIFEAEKKELLKCLLNNKKEYQDFEKYIKTAEWNSL